MNIRRQIEFARHIPSRQFLRRIYLRLKRRLLDSGFYNTQLKLSNETLLKLHLPHLPAPHGVLLKGVNGWEATFLGSNLIMGDKIDWTAKSEDQNAQLWQMNLHYFEYLENMNVDDARIIIDDWITTCRPRTKLASRTSWTPYAISLRISAWMQFIEHNDVFGDHKFQKRMAASLREQADYLCSNLETDVRGNHLIKNIRALTEVGNAFSGPHAKKWRCLANKHLKREIKAQILADGVHFERSISYHSQVFCDLLAIAVAREKDGFSEILDKTLIKMALALRDLTHPDGGPIQFNDSGLEMCISVKKALLEFKTFYGPLPQVETSNIQFPIAGYYGHSSAENYIIFKMGPLGPDELMAHAHGDWGSFEWSHKGQRVFVDQGVFEYVNGDKRRKAQSTRSHNTAVINNAEQAEFFGAFRCGKRPHPAPPPFTTFDSGFELRGQMSSEVTKGIQHNRLVKFDGINLTLRDSTNMNGMTITSRLLLHPSIRIKQSGGKVRLLSKDSSFELTLTSNEGTEVNVEPAIWWPNMGVAHPTYRIIVRSQKQTKVEIIISTMEGGTT